MKRFELVSNPEIETLNKIGYDALMEVTAQYGTGEADIDNEYVPESSPLAYHNMSHTIRVRDASRRLARYHGLDAYDEEFVATIASAHDIYHHAGSDEYSDEELSATWLKNTLAANGFSAEEQEIARLAILGTAPILDTDGTFMGQQFTLTWFPSTRAGEIALCVAAADMEAVFSPYSAAVAHDLFKERHGYATTDTVDDISPLIQFQTEQIAFLADFTPLYPKLEQFFGGLRQELISYHTALREAIITGQITTWEEVVVHDVAFSQEHSSPVIDY